MDKRKFFVFDVESVGIQGEGFAVAYVLVDRKGNELRSGISYCDPVSYFFRIERGLVTTELTEDVKWVMENVIPHLPSSTHHTLTDLRHWFWNEWLIAKAEGAELVSDCAWPVEARFLAACVDDDIENRKWQGPYPLFDVSTLLLAAGEDPTGTYDRLPNELPAHNPLADARQSARRWIELLNKLEGKNANV